MDRFCHRFFEQCINHDAVTGSVAAAAGVSFVLVLSHEDTVNVALLVTIVSSVASRCHASPFPPLPLFRFRPFAGSAGWPRIRGPFHAPVFASLIPTPTLRCRRRWRCLQRLPSSAWLWMPPWMATAFRPPLGPHSPEWTCFRFLSARRGGHSCRSFRS